MKVLKFWNDDSLPFSRRLSSALPERQKTNIYKSLKDRIGKYVSVGTRVAGLGLQKTGNPV